MLFLDYSVLGVYLLICIFIGVILFFVPYFIAPQDFDVEKLSAYECGFEPFQDARVKFDIQFYLLAILFIIFDIEIIYFLPWLMVFTQIGFLGYLTGLGFFFLLVVGFYYEWMKGALDWHN